MTRSDTRRGALLKSRINAVEQELTEKTEANTRVRTSLDGIDESTLNSDASSHLNCLRNSFNDLGFLLFLFGGTPCVIPAPVVVPRPTRIPGQT